MKPPMIYSPVQLANTMRLVRQKNNWTQSDLAKRIGIKQATISNFENNPDNTTLTTFFRILQSLGMTMALYEKDDAPSGSDNNIQQGLDW
jgi:Predicted transcriptional regulators